MPVVDLSHPITPNMSLFPGTPHPRIEPLAHIATHGYAEKTLALTTHTGTHMDAPAHVLADGPTLDRLPCDRFVGTALVIDCRHCQGAIPVEVLTSTPKAKTVDFILFRTGWDRYWGRAEYARQSPFLSRELVEALGRLELKGIGIDALSPDPIDDERLPAHTTLLKKGVVLIENLRGLDALPTDRTIELTALPLPVADADGAPARVIARL